MQSRSDPTHPPAQRHDPRQIGEVLSDWLNDLWAASHDPGTADRRDQESQPPKARV